MCSVHNAVEIEKRGTPATVVITAAFQDAVVHQFRGKGMSGHPYIQVPHPVYYYSREEMSAIAKKCVEETVRQITA